MKKTLNVNIGGVLFTMNEDAYYTLNNYYDDIRSRLLSAECQDVMDDIEARTADILRENLAYSNQIVEIDHIRRVIAMIGSAQTFGEQKQERSYEPPVMENKPRRLYRSRKSVIGGVCGGVAEYFNIDPTVVRLLTLLFVFFGGLSVWIYIILWIVLPQRPRESVFDKERNERRDRQ
ncbi:PspC domain-containing protein [Alistipes sp. OttesenSCG-928-B03]|nr:PspC domain-containing protein [Alistipes sp. OttesenSCG-928-B03]